MGMFDTVRSSYDLGPRYTNVDLQTKDLECLMNEYWISPSGQLYEIDYSHTADFVELGEDDPRYDPVRGYLNFVWIPNGRHGKVRPVHTCKSVELYPASWDDPTSKWSSCFVTFWNGIVRMVNYG